MSTLGERILLQAAHCRQLASESKFYPLAYQNYNNAADFYENAARSLRESNYHLASHLHTVASTFRQVAKYHLRLNENLKKVEEARDKISQRIADILASSN